MQTLYELWCKWFGHKWIVTINNAYQKVEICERCGKIRKHIKRYIPSDERR